MRFFLILFVCFSATIISSNAQSAAFDRLTIENGLSQGMIFDVLQSRDGFLWVATKDGLNRYDGYNFKVFSNDRFNPFSLADNSVNFLFEDSRGWLWIGTESKGIDLYDRRSGRFHHFPLNSQLNQAAGSYYVRSIVEGRDGAIWAIQQGGGLIRIQIPASWKTQLPANPELWKETGVTHVQIDKLDKNQEILIGLWEQQDGNLAMFSTLKRYQVDVRSATARQIEPEGFPAYTGTLSQGKGIDQAGLWLAGNINELFFIKGQKVIRYQSPVSWISHPYSIQDDGAGHVWLVFGKKIWQLTTATTIDFDKPDWEIDRDITCIKTDRNGNIWLGTTGYGLRRINPKRQLFHAEVLGKSIWRVWRDPHGGYFWRDVSEMYRHELSPEQSEATLAFPELEIKRKMDLVFNPDGTFWLLGAEGKDNSKGLLWLYSAGRKILQTHSFDLNVYDYMRLLIGRDGNIWISGANCQFIRFDPRTAHFEYFDYGGLFGDKRKTVQALALTEDGNGVFWIGTQQGLIKAVLTGQTIDFQLLSANSQNSQGLSNNAVACLLPDPVHPADVLWIGTKGGGINRLDLHTGQFGYLSTNNGLPDKVVYGILPGNENPDQSPISLWCSTNRGLAKITPRPTTPVSYEVTTFTAAKGLQDNEFNTQAFSKAPDGELLFGGVNGMNRFFPEALHSDTVPPPVFIVGIEINHHPVNYGLPGSPLTAPVEYVREIQLSYEENNLSFEFAALDFTDPSQNRYRYRLVNLDADWVETGIIRFAHFTHLAPGRYEFKVEGNNGEGGWQAADHSIIVVVHPPWYRSNLAYLLYVILLAWAGWRIYQFQIGRLKEREQLVYEQRETERVKAMEQTKTNFFSNITHEFRTPLTLILEPARRILAKTREPETRENARHVEANSYRLLALVNQLLDMAKIESGSMGLDLRQSDLSEHVRTVFRSFQPLAEQRDIHLSLKLPDAIPSFSFDQGKVELVLNNLISNALKFTPSGGKVTVACQRMNSLDGSTVCITVSDTGIGIASSALEKVFDRFFQVDSSSTRAGEGTGIGLALSKELAELMGGSLTVQSEVGQGSVFTFLLPEADANAVTSTSETLVPDPAEVVLKSPALRDPAELPCVLLIEDNAELRAFVKACISHAWQVVEASNGQEGVEKALEIVPDLVISDVMMPVKDGYTVCDELKTNEWTSHIPVILLTAKSTTDAKIKGLRTGADDYLTKPFNSDELLARMENLIVIRRRLRQRYGQPLIPDKVADAEFLTVPDREFLRRFTLTVEQHLSDELIGVEDLAQKMLVSRVQLHRKLKAITDQNVSDFVRDYRLERAMAMLKNREGMVYEVASKVGFGSEKYFSRAFKEKFGVSPSQIN